MHVDDLCKPLLVSLLSVRLAWEVAAFASGNIFCFDNKKRCALMQSQTEACHEVCLQIIWFENCMQSSSSSSSMQLQQGVCTFRTGRKYSFRVTMPEQEQVISSPPGLSTCIACGIHTTRFSMHPVKLARTACYVLPVFHLPCCLCH